MLKTRFSVRHCRTFTVTTKKLHGPSGGLNVTSWLLLNLIVTVVYHPDQHPDTSDAALNEYLTSFLHKIEAKLPNSGILVQAGDFNKFDFKASAKCYQLEPIIKIPTRGKINPGSEINEIEEILKASNKWTSLWSL